MHNYQIIEISEYDGETKVKHTDMTMRDARMVLADKLAGHAKNGYIVNGNTITATDAKYGFTYQIVKVKAQ